MITVGVDLAAEPASTAVATIEWGVDVVTVREIRLGADDGHVVSKLMDADHAALDAPFGWPEPFIEFLLAHRSGAVVPPSELTGIEWRRTLSRRATDKAVTQLTGVTPLSVSADRIAAVAMRAAGILGALEARDRPVDRAGSGFLVEAYPAAALQRWGLPFKSYKGPHQQLALGHLMDAVLAALPLLRLTSEQESLCRRSDDAFDSLVCALIARATAVGLTAPPTSNVHALAQREGWIMLPTSPLAALGPGQVVKD